MDKQATGCAAAGGPSQCGKGALSASLQVHTLLVASTRVGCTAVLLRGVCLNTHNMTAWLECLSGSFCTSCIRHLNQLSSLSAGLAACTLGRSHFPQAAWVMGLWAVRADQEPWASLMAVAACT